MNSIKETIANKIVKLRKLHNMTQLELANMMNYSDKAISKWERCESTPDVEALLKLSEIFQVKIEYFFVEDKEDDLEQYSTRKTIFKTKLAKTLLSIIVTFLIALSIFELAIFKDVPWKEDAWLAFIWALPVSCIQTLFFFKKFPSQVGKIIVQSLFTWTAILAVYLQFYISFDINFWMFFILGAPIEAIFCIRPLTNK